MPFKGIWRQPMNLKRLFYFMENRVIKFRAYHLRLKKMVNPDLYFGNCNDHPKGFHIMQFIGLKDKNGKEIYEGDIVRWGLGFTGSYDKEHWHRYAVVEINPDIQFRIIYYETSIGLDKKPTDNYIFKFGNFAYKETELYLEVIGNIHENTDLLNT